MPVKRNIPFNSGSFFITFTCYQWLPLIAATNSHDLVYNWFDRIKSDGHFINGYVIMPNHIHALISFVDVGQAINTIVGNGKRFMAYDLVQRQKSDGHTRILKRLSEKIEPMRKESKKLHNVWELSFDWKQCISNDFTWQKLRYMHNNPCVGKWKLAAEPIGYLHSSAKFYLTGQQGIYPVTNFLEMQDICFGDMKG